MWVGPHPCQFQVDLIGADVGRQDATILTYTKNVLYNSDGPTPLVTIVCHYSDGIVAQDCLSIVTVGYGPLVQRCIVVVLPNFHIHFCRQSVIRYFEDRGGGGANQSDSFLFQ
jgi:hypothetical protein